MGKAFAIADCRNRIYTEIKNEVNSNAKSQKNMIEDEEVYLKFQILKSI